MIKPSQTQTLPVALSDPYGKAGIVAITKCGLQPLEVHDSTQTWTIGIKHTADSEDSISKSERM